MQPLTTGDVATLLGISYDTVRRLIENGALPGARLMDGGGWYRIDYTAFVEYAERKNIRIDWSLIDKQ